MILRDRENVCRKIIPTKRMTAADSIQRCLTVIFEQFYAGKPTSMFYRDKRQLTKAICRFGQSCTLMGWDFDANFITRHIVGLLVRISRTDFDHLPSYLESAIDSSVRQKAEELGEADKLRKFTTTDKGRYPTKRGEQAIDAVIGNLKAAVLPDSVVVVKESDTAVMANLWKTLNKRGPKKAPVKQLSLL